MPSLSKVSTSPVSPITSFHHTSSLQKRSSILSSCYQKMAKEVTFKTTYLDTNDHQVTIECREMLPANLCVEQLPYPGAKYLRNVAISTIHSQHRSTVAQKSRQACIFCGQRPEMRASLTDNGGIYAESAQSHCWVVPVCGGVCEAHVKAKLVEATGDNNRMSFEKFQTAVNNLKQTGPAAPTAA